MWEAWALSIPCVLTQLRSVWVQSSAITSGFLKSCISTCISKCEIWVMLGLFTHIAILEQTQTLEQNWMYRVVRRWCRGDVLLVSIPNRVNTCRTLLRRIWRTSEHRVNIGNHNDGNNNEWCLSMFVGFCLSVMTISCNSASWVPLIDLFLKLFWLLNEFIRLRITSSVRPSMGEPGGGGGVSTFRYSLPLAPVLCTQTLSSHELLPMYSFARLLGRNFGFK